MSTTYIGAEEYAMTGCVGRVHAIACHDAVPWQTTVCGLPAQAYPASGQAWDAVAGGARCSRCADAVGSLRTLAHQPSARLVGMEWWRL
jgi:hypothetical protein